MKTFPKIFAVIALMWAVLSPPLLSVLDAANGIGPMTRFAHRLAGDLSSVLPKEPLTDTTVVSLPAQRVSNAVAALDWATEAIQKIVTLHTFYTVISSVAIIILAICILRTSRQIQTPPPNTALEPTPTAS